jgi:hypothetical protein
VRRAIAVVAALFLMIVPAALAATGTGVPAAVSSGSPVQPSTTSERPLIHREASQKLRAATQAAKRKRAAAQPKVSIPPQMEAIANCESHGNPRSIGGGGLYRGKYQMTTSIWASVGGKGDPAAASEQEQDRRAAMLYNRSGAGQWPVCGQ